MTKANKKGLYNNMYANVQNQQKVTLEQQNESFEEMDDELGMMDEA